MIISDLVITKEIRKGILAFLITIKKKNLFLTYLTAELTEALLLVFSFFFIDNEVNLGANPPNYIDYPIYIIAGIGIIVCALLMLVILIVVYTQGTKKVVD